jgi:hypothetical protein
MLDKALRGEFSSEENNDIITEYCQSCHIHRAFDPSNHTVQVHALYDREPYTTTIECRICHLVHENTWGMKRRKTLWPAQVAQQGK